MGLERELVHLDVQVSFEVVFETVLSVVLLGRNEMVGTSTEQASGRRSALPAFLETVSWKKGSIS